LGLGEHCGFYTDQGGVPVELDGIRQAHNHVEKNASLLKDSGLSWRSSMPNAIMSDGQFSNPASIAHPKLQIDCRHSQGSCKDSHWHTSSWELGGQTMNENQPAGDLLILARWCTTECDLSTLARHVADVTSKEGLFVFARCYESLMEPATGFLVATVQAPHDCRSSIQEAMRSIDLPVPSQASTYRYRIGSYPGVDYLFGSGPATIYGTNLDPTIDSATEAEWNHYYDTQHFSTVVTYDGYVAGTRLTHEDELVDSLADPDRSYIVIYELVDESILETWHAERMPERNRDEYERWLRLGEPHTRDPLWLWGRPILP
jgi:hypothetical protein